MYKIISFCLLIITLSYTYSDAQNYEFEEICDNKATNVISQGRTGTCWSFSTTSFLESEIIRLTGKEINLSEMYTVRNTYPLKAWNYVMRQGKAQFSEGGLAHDVINSVAAYGLVPDEAFLGREDAEDSHNHAELVAVLKGMLEVYIKKPAKALSPKWKAATEAILDLYLGENPEEFQYEGKKYSPQSFLKMTKIKTEDYISLTTFTHQPYYKQFILNIPDNFSNGSFYNLPLDEFMAVIDHALKNGFTVELDCDVSEDGFSARNGVAIVPDNPADLKAAMKEIKTEKKVTAAYRQQEFENQNTTDDHLMHITGMLKDQKGNVYYKVKNSWGDNLANGGYVYMSAAYMRLKTISILLHKDGIPKETKTKLKIQ
jgi:bleomycin hydrolase